MERPADRERHVAIVGGGVIGLAIAWRLAQGGQRVTVLEGGKTGQGASHAAAGMLAAVAEAEPGETALLALNRESQRLWPAFAAELEAESGNDIGLRREGTLLLALNGDDTRRLQHLHAFQRGLDLPVEWLDAAEVRRREPFLAASLAGALYSPQDWQVDNRLLAAALRRAAERRCVEIREAASVERVETAGGRVCGVRVDGALLAADMVVLAAGAWSRQIEVEGVPKLPVRPIKGQMLALQMDPAAPLLSHVVWAPGVYLVPRRDGRLILGATVEEKGFDNTITAGGMLSLLEAAWRALPGIEELPIAEQWVGFRPGSRDDAPILGFGPLPGLVYATGHHRNGILLAPVTADAVAATILADETDPRIAAFGPERFAMRRAAE